jgi:hypothetical protein
MQGAVVNWLQVQVIRDVPVEQSCPEESLLHINRPGGDVLAGPRPLALTYLPGQNVAGVNSKRALQPRQQPGAWKELSSQLVLLA